MDRPANPDCKKKQQNLIKTTNGNDYLSILHLEEMDPFFVSLTSDSDVWAFISSTGALSAGRGSPEEAFFPYYTVDKIHDSYGITGPVTLIRLETGETWEPFNPHAQLDPADSRHLDKSVPGNILRFGEERKDLGLSFSYHWQISNRFGLVRQASIQNKGSKKIALSLLDGLRDLMPPGVGTVMQAQFSCLSQAYRKNELLETSRIGIYALSAGIIDQPIPLESLKANTVWSTGLPGAQILLSDAAPKHFRDGVRLETQLEQRGERGGYFLHTDIALEPGEQASWTMVIDGPRGGSEIADLHHELAANPNTVIEQLTQDLDAGNDYILHLLSNCDAWQKTSDSILDAHHCANVTYNMMRGGTPLQNYDIPAADFADFVRHSNRVAADLHADLLGRLDGWLPYAELQSQVEAVSDPVLERLLKEFLPLTFSRRHGDPSRPWNKFRIMVRQPDGSPRFAYQGNWRDIFQNWEALALSYPRFLEHMIAKFVNASTMDGYNPYRITDKGLDWEEPDPNDPWAGIGYWGDHQIVYLTKLLEWQESFFPGSLCGWLGAERFVYADVPYTIAPLEQILKNPRDTITFDKEKSDRLRAQWSANGSDATLRHDAKGEPYRVTFLEKLLVPILVKLTNFVPGGGIWLNTQRPEWNDANNALVGYGLSMVTVCQLRRHLAFLQPLLKNCNEQDSAISAPVAKLFQSIQQILIDSHGDMAAAGTHPDKRADVALQLAEAGSRFRKQIYAASSFEKIPLWLQEVAVFCAHGIAWLDASIRIARRDDGLYHSYNVLQYDARHTRFEVRNLYKMLEGQVAVLGTGLLTAKESETLLLALRKSTLYRADLGTYILYPNRTLPGFLDKGIIPADRVGQSPLLTALVAQHDQQLVASDRSGTVRFQPEMATTDRVEKALLLLKKDPRFGSLVDAERDGITDLYEQVFKHAEFTGRSGTMFGYEGLGCTYWHMVSKLLLAAQETCLRHADSPEFGNLADCYYRIRQGLGFNKTPQEYGAFPTDPYSHTPARGGARQPGMTGQVKEEILTRFGELGVSIQNGTLQFIPRLLRRSEFLSEPASFCFYDVHGKKQCLQLQPGELAFTFCQTPVVYTLTGAQNTMDLATRDGTTLSFASTSLTGTWSSSVFSRDGNVKEIRVGLCPGDLRDG